MVSEESISQNEITISPVQSKVADWYALRQLSNYRLFILICITALFYLIPNTSVLGQSNPKLFHTTLIAYLTFGVIFNHLIRIEKPSHDTQFYIQAYIDILCITVMMHASGGIQSGLGILMVANIAIIGIFTLAQYTFLFAAIATTAVLAQEIYADISSISANTSLEKTGFTGMALFAVAYITSVLLQKRFPYRANEQEKLQREVVRAEELNQQIIQQMDSGIVVINEQNEVQLINDSALALLGTEELRHKRTLSELSPKLQASYIDWEQSPYSGIKSFKNEVNGSDLLPHFTSLENHGTLIHLEDYGQIAQQVQQLKLVSLGELTASIAHEIRNPLAAISNSIQLLSESGEMESENRRILDIAERHCARINRIVEDILQLSRQERNNPEKIDLNDYLREFTHRFKEQISNSNIQLELKESSTLSVEFDKSHLEQILTNLCTNAIAHNPEKKSLKIIISFGKVGSRQQPFVVVSDNGKGIEKDTVNDVFEPFYTTTHEGTGLGLFIIRELCEINNAQISYVAQKIGAGFRILIGQGSE